MRHTTYDITIDDVIDASRNVDVDAVTGWLAEVARPTTSGCGSGGGSSACKGGTGRRAVRRGGR